MTRLWYWRWRLFGREPAACLGCGGPLTQQAVAWCHAAAGMIELSLQGLPFRVCGTGCTDRRQPRPGFVTELEAALLDGGHLPMAHPAGPSGALSCHACASRVWRQGPDMGEVHGTLPFPGLPSIDVTVRDQGDGFDPSTIANPLAPENLLKGSGRGIFLIRSFMDDVVIERSAGGGMEMRLHKHAPPASDTPR